MVFPYLLKHQDLISLWRLAVINQAAYCRQVLQCLHRGTSIIVLKLLLCHTYMSFFIVNQIQINTKSVKMITDVSPFTFHICAFQTEPCPAGSYSSSGLSPCTLCPVRYYQPDVGQRLCTICEGRKTTASEGSTSQTQCFGNRCQLLLNYTLILVVLLTVY